MYILWKWVELYYFQQWYKNGAHSHQVPLSHGIWEDLANQVISNKNRSNKIVKKNKLLLSQFNKTAQALPYATIILNKKHEMLWINEVAYEIIGVKQSQDENTRITNIVRDPIFISLLNDDHGTEDIKMNHPRNKEQKIHVKLIKLSNKRFLLVARDISEQDALRQSRKAFVANASHELRTPLTVIMGYLQILHETDEIPQQWQAAIQQALNQSSRMEKIINDMLKLSSIEHERYLESSDSVIEMPGLLNRLFNDVKSSSKAKTHKFEANIDSTLKLKGNEEEIVSICLNLLNNAVIHTSAGTKVSLRWFKQDNNAHLWICDNGQGIEQKHLNHLTERFYRVDNSRDKNTSSTGLGLAIVKQICDNHGAELSIESTINQGSCFKIKFPRII
jgi:two-component system phosphate regulon sensor histidine kinase PhoR